MTPCTACNAPAAVHDGEPLCETCAACGECAACLDDAPGSCLELRGHEVDAHLAAAESADMQRRYALAFGAGWRTL